MEKDAYVTASRIRLNSNDHCVGGAGIPAIGIVGGDKDAGCEGGDPRRSSGGTCEVTSCIGDGGGVSVGRAAGRNAGLYDPAFEHDSCGIALVVDLHGRKSRRIVDSGLTALEHLSHRGATGAEEETGDGAGILVQMPHRFLRAQEELCIGGREEGTYACGLVSLPRDESAAQEAIATFTGLATEESLQVLGWRNVPTDPSQLGAGARDAMGTFYQVAVSYRGDNGPKMANDAESRLALDRMSFCLRKRAEHAIDGLYISSLSCRTIVYKGMLTAHQLAGFYPDLLDERFESAVALVHSRFSTNTFPSWPLAHPYRYIAHNGEINTLTGNRNWMRARSTYWEHSLEISREAWG